MSNKNAIILGVGLADNITRPLQQLSNRLRNQGRQLSATGSELTGAFTYAVVGASAALLKFAGDLDAMKQGLAVTMGSVQAASAEFAKLKKTAEIPGVGLQDALKGSLNLQALGASADQARYIIEGLGKAVALSGGGQFEFGRVMSQFIQMAGKGKILQEDLKFMFEAAPKLRGVVNEVFGTSDAEALRGLVDAREFSERLIKRLNEMEGVAGTVKNDLENLWTSFKVGAGEIGLAILKVTTFDGTLSGAAKTVDKFVETNVKWITENAKLVKGLALLAGGLALSGPLIKLVGNLKILFGWITSLGAGFLKLAGNIGTALTKLGEFAMSAGGLKNLLARGGIVGLLATGISTGTSMGADRMAEYDKRVQAQGDLSFLEDVRYKSEAFSNMFATGMGGHFKQAGEWGKRWLKGVQTPFNTPTGGRMSGHRNAFIPSAPAERTGVPWAPETPFDADFIDPTGDPDTPKGPKAHGPYFGEVIDPNADGKWGKMFSDGGSGFDFTDYLPDNPFMSGAFGVTGDMGEFSTMSDHPMVAILEQYQQAMKEVQAQEAIGMSMQDQLKAKVAATTEAYMSAAMQFGVTSEEAKGYADQLAQLTQEQQTQLELEKEEDRKRENQRQWLSYMQSAAESIGSAFAEVATKGVAGFKALTGAILKAAAAAVKLAVAQWMSNALLKAAANPFSAIPTLLAGGAIIGMIDGLMGQVSLAQGGILTGESIIRAGEYPGAAANPEVIAPLDKLKQYMGDTGGMGPGYIVGEVAGDKILLVTSTAQSFAGRRGSGNKIQF